MSQSAHHILSPTRQNCHNIWFHLQSSFLFSRAFSLQIFSTGRTRWAWCSWWGVRWGLGLFEAAKNTTETPIPRAVQWFYQPRKREGSPWIGGFVWPSPKGSSWPNWQCLRRRRCLELELHEFFSSTSFEFPEDQTSCSSHPNHMCDILRQRK